MYPVNEYIDNMYKVVIANKTRRKLESLPENILKKFVNLVEDMEKTGPVQKRWKNFSKLSESEYHCHLSYKWIACWRNEKESIIIEVYYVGSREDAPY
jgi:mRNA-degrading endonuclease RelE of RelBE toxin-antitoxin system